MSEHFGGQVVLNGVGAVAGADEGFQVLDLPFEGLVLRLELGVGQLQLRVLLAHVLHLLLEALEGVLLAAADASSALPVLDLPEWAKGYLRRRLYSAGLSSKR